MYFKLRYIDRFSVNKFPLENWVEDPNVYSGIDAMRKIQNLQKMGYVVEMTRDFSLKNIKKEVDL
jgi:hypothetical protein